MKYLMIMVAGLIVTLSSFSSQNWGYDKLWKEVANKASSHPKQAFKIVEEIYAKALKEEQEDHLIKAILYKQSLRLRFEDQESLDYILEAEAELDKIKSASGRAVYSHILGKMYHQFGMANQYRMRDRTQSEQGEGEPSVFSSLESIQAKAIDYFKLSLELPINDDLSSMEILTEKYEGGNYLEAKNLEQLVVFSAARHFKDTRSLISLPTDAFAFSDQALFDENYRIDKAIKDIEATNYPSMTMAVFQRAKGLSGLTVEQKVHLEIIRLDFLRNNSILSDKDIHYVSALENLKNRYEKQSGVEPAYCKLISHYLQEGDRTRSQTNVFDYDPYEKASTLINELEASNPDKKYEEQVANFRTRLHQVELSVNMEYVYVPSENILGAIKYRNLSSAFLKVYKLTPSQYEAYLQLHNDYKKINKYLRDYDLVEEKELTINGKGDRGFHSTEFSLTPKGFGHYLIVAEDQSNKVGKALINFHISNLAYAFNQSNTETLKSGYVIDRTSGQPIKGVEVEVLHSVYNPNARQAKWQTIETVQTDDTGSFKVGADGKRYACRLKLGEDVLDLREQHYQRFYQNNQSYYQAKLFTDRAIYRPGQLVYFKGLITEIKDQLPSIVPNQKVEVLFRDANWQEISKQEFTSNEYGTFHGTVSAPETGLNGRMTLEIIIDNGDRGNNRYQHSIQVEEYKRPKIYAEFGQLTDSPKLGDTVSVQGQVSAFSGAPVSSAKYRYRVEKTQNRWWGYRAGRGFGGYNPSVQQVAFGEGETNEKGEFSIQVPTTASVFSYYSFSYTVYVDVVDASGESTSTSKTVNLSDKAFRLAIDCPTTGFVSEMDSLTVEAINAEGTPVNTTISVSVSKLGSPEYFKRKRHWDLEVDQPLMTETEFSQLFPKDALPTERDARMKNNVLLSEQVYTEEKSKLLQVLESGIYELTFTATNEDGLVVEEKRMVEISEKGNKALPTQALWTGNLKSSYQPGEALIWELATPYSEAYVLYRIYNNKGEIEVDWKSLPDDGIVRYKLTEKDRGGFTIDLLMVKDNRIYAEQRHVEVLWTNKKIEIEYTSFRDKLEPGQEEEWTLTFKDEDGKSVSGELVAALYDSSLDQFVLHHWQSTFFPNKHSYNTLRVPGFDMVSASGLISNRVNYYYNLQGISPWINIQGSSFEAVSMRGGRIRSKSRGMSDAMPASASESAQMMNAFADADAVQVVAEDSDNGGNGSDGKTIPTDDFSMRENLKETVFFYPEVEIKTGKATLSFKMNEALTKWKLLLFAHDKELKYAFDHKEIITQKKLMIEPLLPRFVRQGDEIVLTAKISNLSESAINAASQITIEDAITGKAMNAKLQVTKSSDLTIAAGSSEIVVWSLELPKDHIAPLLIRTLVNGGGYSDGEQNILPVLTNRKLVTETMPMHIGGGETKTFDFRALDKLENSSSLTPHNYSLEFTSNPSWIVAKAIPHMTMDSDHTSTISYANAIYGNALMQHLLKEQPALREAIRLWKDEDLTSELEKKSDLKLNTLTETPWVREALGESEQMKKLKLYLDDNYITQQINTYFNKLKARQLSNGGFTWMSGGRDNWYVTQNVLETIGHLKQLGVDIGYDQQLIEKAVRYCDQRMIDYYEDNGRHSQKYLPATILSYLYVRSFFEYPTSAALSKANKFYYKKGEESWTEYGTYQQGLLALAAHRSDRSSLARNLLSSLEDRMIRNEKLGYYWNDQAGYYWCNLNIEKQALMIELFSALKPNSNDLDGLRLFLLKNKQTNNWKTSKATAAACYAFLLGSESWLGGTEIVEVSYPQGTTIVQPIGTQKHTGYYRQDIESSKINTSLREVKVTNPNSGVAWGASYFQYFEDLDKIKEFEDTPAQIVKTVYKVDVDDNGEVLRPITGQTPVAPGDRLRIQIKLSVDRPMEFIELRDMRSSGLEPTNVISQYKWQDGLGYFESTRDQASYFFFDRIAKGNYVFEYDVFAVHQGKFSNGITEFQAMYAPEFSAHSEGIQLQITKP